MWTVTDAVLVLREAAVWTRGFVASGSLPFRCFTEHWSTHSHLPVVVAVVIVTGHLLTAISNYLQMISRAVVVVVVVIFLLYPDI